MPATSRVTAACSSMAVAMLATMCPTSATTAVIFSISEMALPALACAALFAAWVRADCRRRGEDEVLWPLVVVLTTPLIGLLVYFLRRAEVRSPAAGIVTRRGARLARSRAGCCSWPRWAMRSPAR